MEINDSRRGLFQKGSQRWINLPSKEYTNREGEQKWMPYLKFEKKEHHELFCKQAKEAILKYCEENGQRIDTAPSNQESHQNDSEGQLPF